MDLDLEGLYIPNSLKSENTGWLEPDGTFHECEYTEHLSAARELYGTYDTEELAKRGFAQIYWDPIKNRIDYYLARCLTDAQIKWLEDNNIPIREEDVGQL